MAQTNFTPILTYKSDTASAVPSAGNLTNSANGAELAVNTADKRLFTKDSGGSVVELGTNPSSLTLPNGTANGVVYANGSKVLTTGSALTFDGSTLTNTGVGYSVNNANALLRFGNAAATRTGYLQVRSDAFEVWSDQAAVPMVFGVANSEQMRLTSTGLGIGTSSPAFKLDVGGDNGTNIALRSTGTASAVFRAYVNSAEAGTIGFLNGGGTYFEVAGSEGMRLTSTGLGIGTSSPASKLSIYGSSGNSAVSFFGSGGSAVGYMGSTAAGNYITGALANETFIRSENVGIAFSSDYGASVQMRLDPSGNLGLGVTPSADWASSGYKAAVVRSAFLAGGSGAGLAVLGNNAYNDGGGWRYVATGVASYYVQNAGTHSWSYAPSGTAGDAISFTQALTLNASGQLLVGTTSAAGSERLNIVGGTGIRVNEDGVGTKILTIRSDYAGLGPAINVTTSDPLLFLTANTERARITSGGDLLVGTTVAPTGASTSGLQLRNVSGAIGRIDWGKTTSGTQTGGSFYHSGTQVGTITYSDTATAYNTSSDYRLKENIQPMTGALAKIAQLKPCTYNWKADGSAGEGFIAHELQAVVPQCVTGEKDAVDAEGKPQYQGIDVSFLVGTLTAAIQEQQAIIESLKARLDAANL